MATIRPYLRGRLLDIGCGPTTLPDQLPATVSSYIGVDGNQALVDYDAKRYPQHRFILHDLESGPINLPAASFDTVVLTAVVEHLYSPERILRDARPLIAPGGQLLVTTPSPLGDLVHQIGSRIGLFYAEKIVQHIKIFNRRELEAVCVAAGYRVKRFSSFMLGLNQFVVCEPGL